MNGVLPLFFAKIVLSAAMVITITLVAERASTRFAGVLLGFPLGAGLTFFFTGLEQGASFAADSTLWSIQGLSGTLMFCICYLGGSRIFAGGGSLALFTSATSGMVGFFIMAFMLHDLLRENDILRPVVVAAVFLGTALFFRKASSPPVSSRIRASFSVLLFRASFAAFTIVAITGAASLVGPKWTGIFAAFPTTLLPTILILHYHYGGETVPAVFREIPFGMIAIVFFALAVHLTFPLVGVYQGILLSYGVAFFYLLFYEFVLRSFLDRF